MSGEQACLTPRERELGAIVLQYNEVTERLKASHEQLLSEVARLREELAHKNRELERRERLAALGHMAAGLAHEIRNPLGSIQLFASLLGRDLVDSPKQLQLVEKISRAVCLLDGLVGDVLTFAKPCDPQRNEVVLGRVVDEVVELMAPRLQQARVELRVDDDCYGIRLWADDRQLHQILLNTLMNGLEASRLIKTRWPAVKVIVLTMYPEYQARALTAGADAFLVKGCPASDLMRAIREP